MDATRLLEADHRSVETLFGKIGAAKGGARQPLVDQLARALDAHMRVEEAVLYPVMAPVTGQESVEEARTEHQVARHALAEVVRLAPDAPGMQAALEALQGAIEHHVGEEEGTVFPALRKDTAALDEIATPFMRQRLDAGLPTEPAALAAATSKDELLAEARSAGIEGTSSMTKQELAEAVASALG